MGNAVHGSALLLRSMLDAGGDPNARNEFGWPIVFMHFKLGYYKDEERARLDLLLDRGADINSTVPETESDSTGYTLLLYTTQNGLHDSREYENVGRASETVRGWKGSAGGVCAALGVGANTWDNPLAEVTH